MASKNKIRFSSQDVSNLISQGNVRKAIKLVSAQVLKNGSSEQSICGALALCQELDLYDFSAKQVLSELNSSNKVVFVEVANYLLQSQRIDEARRIFSSCLSHDEYFVLAGLGLISCSIQAKDYRDVDKLGETVGISNSDNPDLISAYVQLLAEKGDLVRAEELLKTKQAACGSNQRFVQTRVAVAVRLKKYSEVVKAAKKALKENPADSFLWNNLAFALSNIGEPEAAEKAFLRALKLSEKSGADVVGLLGNLSFLQQANGLGTTESRLLLAKRVDTEFKKTFGDLKPYVHSTPIDLGEKKLHVGFVSDDLKMHSVTQFLIPLLENFDRDLLEVSVYSTLAVQEQDAVSQKIKQLVDRWVDINPNDIRGTARKVFKDNVAILFDLNGFTKVRNLGVFCMKPAPIQVTYLGYFATTGVDAIDYWLSDDVLHPESTAELACEKIIRLKRCWASYGPMKESLSTERSKKNINRVQYACYAQSQKYNRKLFQSWIAILSARPNVDLVLYCPTFSDVGFENKVREMFEAAGISERRLSIRPKVSYREYLESYKDIDLVLDSFPRTGGTTTAESLCMGVPVLTVAGDCYPQRLSTTKLSYANLDEFIAIDHGDYVEKACFYAKNIDALRSRRASIQEQFLKSSGCDAKGLASDMLDAFQEMVAIYNNRLS